MKQNGFTLIELLVVIGVIAVISMMIAIPLFGTRDKARDAQRKNDLTEVSRFFALNCYEPDDGEGTYDLATIASELKTKNPQYSTYLPNIKDPKSGTAEQTNYFYIYSATKKQCALYANLENTNDKITLSITVPTAGGGIGVLTGPTGVNGTNLYFQVSN